MTAQPFARAQRGLTLALSILSWSTARGDAQTPRPTARAVRATTAPVIDGQDDDAAWRIAPRTGGFRQFYPREDGAPSVETEFRVAYDDHNLYLFVRAFDPHPDSIMHALTRRDVVSASDVIGVTIDGYHDRRTGVEFVINPAGVKKDCAVYADTLFDWSWDGVWDAAARIDSAGWTAEFRIPLSQFRYTDTPAHTFGLAVWRTSYRYLESSIWPVWRVSRGGIMSQLGDLVGVDSIAAPRALALTPYAVAKNVSRRDVDGYDRAQLGSVGTDLRYALGPNVVLDATVNPDFGQVEADPSVLNLTTVETFYPEKRPFFLQGSRLYQFDLGCNVASCTGEGLFYSRRVGRAPQLAGAFGDPSPPTFTPIAAAAKLTGRTTSGLTIAALDAVTERVVGGAAGHEAIEPATNYGVLRVLQELDDGRTALGAMATTMNRALDSSAATLLRRDAYVAAADFRQWLRNREYGLSGSFTKSVVDGNARSITAMQRSPEHDYQRPDGPLRVDSIRTSLGGDAEELAFGRYRGTVQFLTNWQRRSAGIEINDVGYLQRADEQTLSAGVSIAARTPRWIYRLLTTTASWSKAWTTAWLPIGNAVQANANTLFTNDWSMNAGVAMQQLGTTFCDRCARGGPALRQDALFAPTLSVSGDNRRSIVPSLSWSTMRTDGGRTRQSTVGPGATFQLSTRLQTSVGATWVLNHAATQWYGNFTDSAGVAHYAFARLDQRTLTLTTRASFAATPGLTVEWYASPFVSHGTYTEVRQLGADPRARAYESRFAPYVPPAGSLAGFDVEQLQTNLVARWEYRPGSTLFAVWTHGRTGRDDADGSRTWSSEYRRLFALHPDNTFLVKVAYWFSR